VDGISHDSSPWLIERCDHAIAREAEIARLTAALDALRGGDKP